MWHLAISVAGLSMLFSSAFIRGPFAIKSSKAGRLRFSRVMPSHIAVRRPLIFSIALALLCPMLVLTLSRGNGPNRRPCAFTLTLSRGTGPNGRPCALTFGRDGGRASSWLQSTRSFGMESLAPTFKFGFLSTTLTFEVTGCGSIVIAGERENTHEAVFASLELTMLRKGKDKKSLLTFLLQQG